MNKLRPDGLYRYQPEVKLSSSTTNQYPNPAERQWLIWSFYTSHGNSCTISERQPHSGQVVCWLEIRKTGSWSIGFELFFLVNFRYYGIVFHLCDSLCLLSGSQCNKKGNTTCPDLSGELHGGITESHRGKFANKIPEALAAPAPGNRLKVFELMAGVIIKIAVEAKLRLYFSEGTGISRSLQMFATVYRLISGCLGIAVILPDKGFRKMECFPPSRKSSHPKLRRCLISLSRFMQKSRFFP